MPKNVLFLFLTVLLSIRAPAFAFTEAIEEIDGIDFPEEFAESEDNLPEEIVEDNPPEGRVEDELSEEVASEEISEEDLPEEIVSEEIVEDTPTEEIASEEMIEDSPPEGVASEEIGEHNFPEEVASEEVVKDDPPEEDDYEEIEEEGPPEEDEYEESVEYSSPEEYHAEEVIEDSSPEEEESEEIIEYNYIDEDESEEVIQKTPPKENVPEKIIEVTPPKEAVSEESSEENSAEEDDPDEEIIEDSLHLSESGETTRTIEGLILVSNKDHLLDPECVEDVRGLYIVDVDIPGRYKDLQRILDPIYFDQPFTTQKIREIKGAIHRYYEENKEPFVLVYVPQQEICYDVLQIVIMRSKLGKIKVEGNRSFTARDISRYVHSVPGEDLNVVSLQTDLNFINRNPFRRVNAIYGPGKELGTTDIILDTEDRRTYRLYASADNTGVPTTGRQRIMAGLSLGKVIGLDQVFSYQYTSSYDFKNFQAHTAQWTINLPWLHALNFYGGYSMLEPDLPFPSFTNKGRSTQASGRYIVPLRSARLTTHEIGFGFDYKNTNNNLFFTDFYSNFAQLVNLSQFMLQYKRNHEWSDWRIDYEAQIYYSPGALFENQSDADYEALRAGAKNKYVYGKAAFRYFQRLPKHFTVDIWLRGQLASGNLLPSEQFGIGGFDTVRGYDERQLSMDTAFVGNLEVRSPAFSLISMIRRFPMRDALQFLAFVDYGYGRNHNLFEGEPLDAYLLGIGPGLRYTLDPYIAVRLDYGFRLHHLAAFPRFETGEIHFSVTASY